MVDALGSPRLRLWRHLRRPLKSRDVMAGVPSRMSRALLVLGIFSLAGLLFFMDPLTGGMEVHVPFSVQRAVGRKILESKPPVTDQSIQTEERLEFTYSQTGWLFNEKGRTYQVSGNVTMAMIHSFSPYVEQEAARRFLDPPHSNVYFANSPAVLWHKGELILVTRIWLDREKYEPKKNWPPNEFADNYLYTQRFDRQMRPTTNGSILGIPSPKQWWIGDGPIEPRLIKVRGRVYVTFNAAMAFDYDVFLDFTIMWDIEENAPIIPKIKGGSPMVNATPKGDMPRDKHWMALVENNELYFVHKFDPLRVMHCTNKGYCEFIHNEEKRNGFIFKDESSHLRGGTPFLLYEKNYYISVAHATMFKVSNNHRYYTAHIVVLCTHPYRVVYVSDDLRVHPQVYLDAPMVRPRWIEDGFIFPVSLIIENKDSIVIGVHVNDFSSILLRLRGIKKIMANVIKLDQRQQPKRGPPPGSVHQHVHETLQNITKINFVH